MKTWKKALSCVLALVMVVCLLPVTALAASVTDCTGGDGCTHRAAIDNTHYDTLTEAIGAAQDGATVTLLQDVTASVSIGSGKNITLDLGENTLSGSISIYNGSLTLKNGLLKNSVANGQAINIFGSTTDGQEYSSLTVAEDATIEATYAVILRDVTDATNKKVAYGSQIDIYGKLNGNIWVMGNISNDLTTASNPSTVHVHDGAVVNASGTAIALQGAAKMTIDKATITGGTGVEVRAGELVVNGATIIGTATPTEVTSNGNGTTTVGAGIAVAQHTTKLPISVTINSGNISGHTAFYESNPQGNDEEYIEKIELNVAGGNYTAINNGTSAVHSDTQTGFISGGSFSTNVDSKYVPSGMIAEDEDGDGTYTIGISDNAEAKIGATAYATLAEAIEHAQEGDTVTLLRDVTVSVPAGTGAGNGAINITKNITIDGNNHTIFADDESFDMTMLWGTTVAGQYHVINVTSGATVTLQNLTIDGDWDETEDASVETGNAARSGINVYGENTTVTVKNVTVQNCSVYGAVVNGTNAALTATDLTTTGNRWGVNADNSGSVTIHSGTINEAAALVVEGGSATVEGGTFKGAVGVKAGGNGTLLVKDGNFANPVDKDDLDDSLNAELFSASNPEAPYSYYKSVDEATKAAQPGDVVKDLTASTGTDTNVTVTFAEGYLDNNTISVPAGSQITLPTPKRNGYYFLGWSDGSKVYQGGATYTVTGNATLTARWASIPGTIIAGEIVNGLASQVQSPFVDVTTMDYYYDAVNWAVEEGITTGTGRYTFSPDEACTRAQAVTFLWRAAGSPAPKRTSTPFVDVDSNAYYYKAVLWAVENGVTVGTSDTTFSPSETCTRAQIVTFLYRAFGKQVNRTASFTDVAADAYYAPAVAWAAANSITGGTGNGKFSPAATCTRAQIVTFLYRCCG